MIGPTCGPPPPGLLEANRHVLGPGAGSADQPEQDKHDETLAIGRVRFHVTGSPPTCSERAAAPGMSGPRPLMATWRIVTRTTQPATATSTSLRLGERELTA